MADSDGYCMEHRLVMARGIGRPLTPNDIVHHRNGDKTDNAPENLEITDRKAHLTAHRADVTAAMKAATVRSDTRVCSGCQKIFIPKRLPRFDAVYCSRMCYLIARWGSHQ